MAEPSSHRLTLACTAGEAEAIAGAEIDGVALVTTEEDEAAGRWRLDAYFEGAPDAGTLAAVRALVAAPGEAVPAPVADADWVTLSQAGLEPIREGRFFVHTAAHGDAVPDAAVALRIEASQAFGTGHHATTAGCLAMLETLADRPIANVVDLGTGTGLLAFAARHIWPGARVMATDIDPVAVAVARGNMADNGLADIGFVVADGARDAAIAAAAPFDLVIANILAGPLIAMAAEIAAIASPGAAIVLAGLLTRQAADVADAYAAAGCVERDRIGRGDWTILRLEAGAAAAVQQAGAAGDRTGWARDA